MTTKPNNDKLKNKSDDPVLIRYREMFPELSDEQLEELIQVT